MEKEPIYVGIDVSKDRIDVAVRPTGRTWSVSYNEVEVDGLVSELRGLAPEAVIAESTGGLELPLAAALAAASVPVAIINPRQARDLPSPQGSWPRQTGWTLRFWLISARLCVLHTRSAGLRHSCAWQYAGAAATGEGHTGGREEPLESRDIRDTSSHPVSYNLAATGTGRPGRRVVR